MTDVSWSARRMFDQDTFAARHGKSALGADPVLAMLAKRKRLCDLAAAALAAAEEIEVTLAEKLRTAVLVSVDGQPPLSGRYENNVHEASGCASLLREADALYGQADALDEQIWQTQATSVAGILGQLERVKEAVRLQEDCEGLIDTIIAGIEQLAANSSK
jgi:hypothetical protein